MKKLILTGSLCLLLAITFGQSVTYKEIDFRESKSEINTEIVKTGSQYGLKINNINKKLYIIDNKVTQTSYHETAPALFDLFTKASLPEKAAASSGFSLGDRELVSNEEISAAKLSSSLASKVKALKSLYYLTADTLLKNDQKLVRFGDAYNELKKSIYFDQDLKEVQNDCNTAFEDIQKKVVAKAKKVYSTTTMLDTDRITLASEDTGYEEIPVLLKRYFTKIIEKDVRDAFKHLNIDFSPSRRDALSKSVAKINTLLGEVISLLEKEEKTNKDVKAILVKFKSERDNEKIKGLLADKMAIMKKLISKN